ncbi:retinol dehydrogenase 16 isoform X2 [Pipistrellus kuhlii]|uniref:retinol dehydrogenase 16 isoform X2 n=1 Tax=Pipistrellus kuhlii TaxID=59472 RepID=UPI001E272EED|nr:retinol dehydrogenase 16 isoform X2 [Pipistrellus kuhlii]
MVEKYDPCKGRVGLSRPGTPLFGSIFTDSHHQPLPCVLLLPAPAVLRLLVGKFLNPEVYLCSCREISRKLGLWGLVNNAGISVPTAPNEWLTKQDFVKILNVNLLGVIEVTLSLLPLVRKAKGRVVNVSSIFGRVAFIGGGYCISKYGVEAFSDSLRRELSHFGVKVAIIEPGFFKTFVTSTPVISRNFQEAWEKASPEVKEAYGERFLAHSLKVIGLLDKMCSQDLSLVTNCMEHALTACHPRTRYSSGWDAKLIYLPMSYMPTFLVDALVNLSSSRPAKAM